MIKYCELCNKRIGLFKKIYKLDGYSILCYECYIKEGKRIEENNRIKAQKQEKEKLICELLTQVLFKKEFLKEFYNLAPIYKSLNAAANGIDKYISILNKRGNTDYFLYFTYEMNKEIGNSETINKANEVFFDEAFIRRISDSVLQHSFSPHLNGHIYNTSDIVIKCLYRIKTQENEVCSKVNNVLCNVIYERNQNYRWNKFSIGMYTYSVMKDIFTYRYTINKSLKKIDDSIHYFLVYMLYANAFMRAIILSRNINKFINNIDLYKMYKNLKDGTNYTIAEISDKLFPIYNLYYTDTFQDKFDKSTFDSLIKMVDNHCNIASVSSKELENNKLYKNEVYECISRGQLNLRDFEILLEKTDNKIFFDAYKFNNVTPENNTAYRALYYYLIQKTGENIPVQLLFQIVADKFNYINLLKSKDIKAEIEKEKERLLKGDLSIEKKQEIDMLDFANIKTGYEFENYLKNIFDKLDYKSFVTKSSGDQGGDLVIEKDGIKAVVQAKFYSVPVGNKAVQEVVSAIAFYKVNKGIVVTNNVFTKSAIELAKVNNIELIDGKKLNDIRSMIIKRI